MTNAHPLDGGWIFSSWRAHFFDQWTISPETINVAMYEDSQMGSLFGLTALGNLYFYPHMDASPNIDLWVGSDFRVMEDHVCSGLAAEQTETYRDFHGRDLIKISPIVPCGHKNVFE